MTCVIGIVEGDHVWMGADSVTTRDHGLLMTTGMGKIFSRGEMLIAASGSPRLNQLMRYTVEIPEHPAELSTDEYMVDLFIEAVRSCFSERGFATFESGQELGGHALIAYRGMLYEMGCEYALEPQKISAIGSGSYYALGALPALAHLQPPDRIQRALQIVSNLDPFVGPPFILWRLGDTQPYTNPNNLSDLTRVWSYPTDISFNQSD